MMRKMQRIAALLMALMLISASALAASVMDDAYSDAPANPTQENVDQILAAYATDIPLSCAITTMEPTRLTVDILQEIFDFVDINAQPPARYFPEKTQEEIRRIIDGADPDILYMPEFMSLLPEKIQADADVTVDMQMNIDYQEGQLIVPVLGRNTEAGVEWKALPAQILAENTVHFNVPKDVAARYFGTETLFALLTVKPGHGKTEIEHSSAEEPVFIPSKNASDMIYVADDTVRSEAGAAVDCQIIIVAETKETRRETEKLMQHFTDPEKKPIRYFDADTVHEAALILKDTDIDALIPYEITQVMAVDYQEPYGDVMARFKFPTPFEKEKAMIALIGMPQRDGAFQWMPLHTEITDDAAFIEITFSSSVLPAMMDTAGLLLIMSEPLDIISE